MRDDPGIEIEAITRWLRERHGVDAASVAFLPPTLIASIYGMNFRVLPELGWSLGYPFALLLMIGSAVTPFWYFRRRGWLR